MHVQGEIENLLYYSMTETQKTELGDALASAVSSVMDMDISQFWSLYADYGPTRSARHSADIEPNDGTGKYWTGAAGDLGHSPPGSVPNITIFYVKFYESKMNLTVVSSKI
jgi:hypothetical protein